MSHSRELVNDLFNLYSRSGPFSLDDVRKVYANTVIFEDPLHRYEGIQSLLDYLNRMYSNVQECHFDRKGLWVCEETNNPQQVFVQWNMNLRHPSLNGGKAFSVEGISRLHCGDRIYYHRDFFDVGALLYERAPLVGALNRWLKRQAG